MRKSSFIACLLLASLTVVSNGQNGAAASAGAGASFGYRFENARFHIPLIEIDLAPDGTGELRFKRGESDEVIDLKLKLLPATIERIRTLYGVTGFLTSKEEYQSKKDFSNLGWVTLSAREGDLSREVRFNYSENRQIKELYDIFRAIATQQMHLFDLDTAEQYQPLDLPTQLGVLERDLELERIAEPEQMLAALNGINSNDALPLIARNHAKRIAEKIEKKKFKSPVKKTVDSSQ
ncbi:MAG TPA: hypothetical protein VKA70_04940 [Blastocatellia bacterium]|nr:hypothetical protein [Blastocatellia bacterium]